MKTRCGASYWAVLLAGIGAINWGLVGVGHFFNQNWDLVNQIIGRWGNVSVVIADIVYILVGIAGIMILTGCKCSTCMPTSSEGGAQCGDCEAGTCSVHQ